MEKLKQARFTGLKSAERLQDIYHQTYLELEVGERIKLSHFNNFEVHWRQVQEEKTIEAFHDLDDDKVLRYTCQLEPPDEVKALLGKIEQTEFSSNYTQELMEQTIEILATDILGKQAEYTKTTETISRFLLDFGVPIAIRFE